MFTLYVKHGLYQGSNPRTCVGSTNQPNSSQWPPTVHEDQRLSLVSFLPRQPLKVLVSLSSDHEAFKGDTLLLTETFEAMIEYSECQAIENFKIFRVSDLK